MESSINKTNKLKSLIQQISWIYEPQDTMIQWYNNNI